MLPELNEEIEVEMQQLRRLFATFAPLRAKAECSTPDEVETVALAGFLHAFYNGVENVFRRTAKHLDGGVPAGEMWHRALLDRMTRAGERRPAVVTESLRQDLRKYMDFRHRFRHAYPFELKWHHMAPLVLKSAGVFQQLESEIATFVKTPLGKDDEHNLT